MGWVGIRHDVESTATTVCQVRSIVAEQEEATKQSRLLVV
jgi:hypothetical protein